MVNIVKHLKNRNGVASPCRTTCTVCGDAPCYAFLSIQLYVRGCSAWPLLWLSPVFAALSSIRPAAGKNLLGISRSFFPPLARGGIAKDEGSKNVYSLLFLGFVPRASAVVRYGVAVFPFARMAETAWLSRLARFRVWVGVLLADCFGRQRYRRRAGFVLRRRWAVRYRCRLRHWRLPGCSRRRRVRGLL